MSNPGVIELSSSATKRHSFRVEDNIGEAIHLHIDDNIRLDLTVRDFFALCKKTEGIINELVEVKGFDAKEVDPLFLKEIAPLLSELERVEKEKIFLDELIVDKQWMGGISYYGKLKDSRVVKALQGQRQENDAREQTNLVGQSNGDRTRRVMEGIRRCGYPIDGTYMILFNNENWIRDGQHRAACLYLLYGNVEVEVLRFYFRGGKYSSPKAPFYAGRFVLSPSAVFSLSKNCIKTVLKQYRRIVRRGKDFYIRMRIRFRV